jgi:parallel beta-helix repeat protein
MSNVTLEAVDIANYTTGVELSGLNTVDIVGLEIDQTNTGLRGTSLVDASIDGSNLRGSSSPVLITTDVEVGPGQDLTITNSTIGDFFTNDLDGPSRGASSTIAGVSTLTGSGNTHYGKLTIAASDNVSWQNSHIQAGAINVQNSSTVTVSGNVFDGIGEVDVPMLGFVNVSMGTIQANTITGPGDGILVESSQSVTIFENTINETGTGLNILGDDTTSSSGVEVYQNTFTTGITGIFVENTFVEALDIHDNLVSDFEVTGIHAVGYAALTGNTVETSGVGFRIEDGQPGMWLNTARDNDIGVTGTGFLGNDDRTTDKSNVIHNNTIGILAEGGGQTVAFNRVFDNQFGISIEGESTVRHNVIFDNSTTDVRVRGASGSSLWNNTIYSTGDTAVRLESISSNTDIRNNIVWSVGGTALDVEFPSGDNLQSDYNTWYVSNGGTLFKWIKTFDDMLDWQIELGLDLNSLGTTRIDPTLDEPSFVDLANNDFTIVDGTSRSINSGDPSFTYDNEPGPNDGPNGLRINQGAYGDTALAALSPATYIRVLSPNYYLDYSADVARRIVWEFFNVGGNVSLELIENGVGKVADMTTVTIDNVPDQVVGQPASHGSYLWSPQMSGIVGDNDKRYFIRVVSADNAAIDDSNREPFSVPVGSNAFYVNDASASGDQLTTATGDNRHTGKLPSTPKAILPAILQNYSLAADQTVSVDTGNYLHLQDIVFSSADELGDNEAFTLTGPGGDPSQVVFNRADPREGSVGILLDDSSFVTIRNLTVTGGYRGIEARNFSTFLALDNLRVTNHTGIQVHLHDGADRATLDNIELLDGSGDGLVVDALLQFLTNSLIDNHGGTGVDLLDTGNALVHGNVISNNLGGGLRVYNRISDTETQVGSESLSSGLGNQLVDNGGVQLYARGNTQVAGNAVYHTAGGLPEGGGTGIYLWGVKGLYNVVAGHSTGIYARSGSTIEANRIYNNSIRGIAFESNGGLIERNVLYSNASGIEEVVGPRTGGATIRNNLIYDFTGFAYKTTNANGYVFENNTVYSTSGDGLVIRGSSSGTVVNNIFHLEAGTAIDLDFASQVSLASDYNIFDMTESGIVGTWAGGSRSTLQDWRNASFLDGNSLSIDPLFVDVDGADGILGYASPGNDGGDDNFHLQSLSGSIRNGSLAPTLDAVTGLPSFAESSRVPDASQSPGIDRGDAAYAFDQEPAPNGNFINIGAFGNTSLASLSPVAYVLVTSPNGGETWPIEQTFNIEWRSQNFDGSVDIFLVQEGVVDPVATIALATINDGSFAWSLTNVLSPADNYRIEIVRNDAPEVSGQSLNVFGISEPISFYYVNDGVVDAGGYTTAIGDNANDGLSPATPKASIRAILDAYDLGEGDVVLVDAGTYAVTTNIFIEAEDSLATIRGFVDPARPELRTILDRSNRATGSYVFELTGVDGLTVEWITFINAHRGIYAGDDQATNLTIRENRFINNEDAGIMLESGNRGFLAEGNYFEGSGNLSSGQGRQESGLVYEGWDGVIRGNAFLNNYLDGIFVSPPNTNDGMQFLIEGNTVDNSRYGIRLSGNVRDALIQDNAVFNSAVYGIDVRGARTVATSNTAYDNATGIRAIFGATAIGNVEVYNNSVGILIGSGSTGLNNTAYDNGQGIRGEAAVRLEGNTAHGNGTGIVWNYNTIVVGNVAYGNERGMHANGYIGSNSQWRTQMFNNLSYGNTEYAMLAERTVGSPQIFNNTFVQAGEGSTAVILNLAPNIQFTNNIISVDAGLAMSVRIDSQAGFTSDYNLIHLENGASAFMWGDLSLQTQLDWFYNVGADAHSFFTDPVFVDPGSSNYHLAAGSPAIGAGNPNSHYQLEPEPAGGRINLGAYGNTREASVSPARSIQVLNPVGLDKLLEGQQSIMEFLAGGFLDVQQVAWFNTGTENVGSWIQFPGATGAVREDISDSVAIDLSNVDNPAPEEVYRSNWRTDFGVGQTIDLVLDLQPGDYRLRLHLIDHATSDSEIFDVEVNGSLVLDDYSIFAAAGGRYIPVVEEVDVTVDEEGKLTVTITSGSRYGRISALEVLRLDPGKTANPTFNVAVTYDYGANLVPLANGVTLDPRGIATIDWTPFAETDGRGAQIIVANESLPSISGESQYFLVANSGTSYYVNDSSTANDVYTSGMGNNANSGKSADSPMTSLEALLSVYSPLPGDTIFIDSGTYNLTRNIVLGAAESGITIMGAHDPDNAAAETIFDRGNQASGAYGIELQGAAGVTIEYLTITNDDDGIHAQTAGAVDLTIRNSRFIFNGDNGIYVNRENPGLLVENNYFEGDGTFNVDPQDNGLYYDGTHAVIRDNVFLNNYLTGIDVSSPSPNFEMDYLIEGNTVSGSRTGIRADGWVNDALVQNNTVFNTVTTAMVISGGRSIVTANNIFDNNVGIELRGALATGNTEVYGNTIGIYATTGSKVVGNVVHDNAEGIRVNGSSYVLVQDNISYNNTDFGYRFNHNSRIIGNVAYGNRGGFYADDLGSNSQFRGLMQNNLSYGNSEYALLMKRIVGSSRRVRQPLLSFSIMPPTSFSRTTSSVPVVPPPSVSRPIARPDLMPTTTSGTLRPVLRPLPGATGSSMTRRSGITIHPVMSIRFLSTRCSGTLQAGITILKPDPPPLMPGIRNGVMRQSLCLPADASTPAPTETPLKRPPAPPGPSRCWIPRPLPNLSRTARRTSGSILRDFSGISLLPGSMRAMPTLEAGYPWNG